MTAFVYAIAEQGGAIKIGVAKEPAKRLRDLQVGHPRALRLVHVAACAEARVVERAAHERLSASRASGEWFDVTEAVAIEAIEAAARGIHANVVDSLLALGFGTQARLAACAGVKQVAVSGWRKRNALPYTKMAALLRNARAYGVTLSANDFHPGLRA